MMVPTLSHPVHCKTKKKKKKICCCCQKNLRNVIVPPIHSSGHLNVPHNWAIPWLAPCPASWHMEPMPSCPSLSVPTVGAAGGWCHTLGSTTYCSLRACSLQFCHEAQIHSCFLVCFLHFMWGLDRTLGKNTERVVKHWKKLPWKH